MTPDERDRLARMEQAHADMKADLTEVKGDVKTILQAIHIGRGKGIAWAKAGGYVIAGAAVLGWLWDHVAQLLVGKH